MKKYLYLTILLTVTLISCAGNKSLMSAHKNLYGTKWLLKQIHGDTGTTTVDTKAFLKLDSANNSAGGNGSCNSFGGTAVVKGDSLTITNIFSTKMYCEDVQAVENAFFEQLGKVTGYKITGNQLSLFAGNKVLLRFEAGDETM
jgi:heat shock protein HslJ